MPLSDEQLARLQALRENDPAGFYFAIQKFLPRVVIPHPGGQREIFECEERFQIACCGRRFGKSKVGVKKILKASRRANSMNWWVAPTYKVVRRAYREMLKQLPPELLAKPAPSPTADGRLILQFKNGAVIEFYSAENPASMVGEGVDYAVVDEAALIEEKVWTQVIRPTLMDKGGSALLISTPRGENWFYDLWVYGQPGPYHREEYKSWRFPSSANPFLPASEIEEMRATLPAAIYEQEVLADFISKSATLFRVEDKNIAHEFAPVEGTIIMGVDLAKHNDFTVLASERLSDRRPVAHARFNDIPWPTQRQLIRDEVRMLRARGATHVKLMLDSTGLGDVVYDDLIDEGYDVEGINFTANKEKMVRQLGSDLDAGVAFLLPAQLEEFKHYSYTISESGKFKYAARGGHHDDEVSAKMLANWGSVHGVIPNVRLVEGEQKESAPGHPGTLTLRDPSLADLLRGEGFVPSPAIGRFS